MRRDEAATAAFLPGGRAPRAGELVRLPDLARTLGTIADQGARAFYEGELGERIAAATRAAGGFLEPGTWPRTARAGSSRSTTPTATWRSSSCRRRPPGSRR